MASIAKAALRNRVLQQLGVLAAGQSPAAEDADLVDEAIDAAHLTLRKFGLCPFATTAIPEWAQIPLRDYVIANVGPSFGVATSPGMRREAERELERQVAGFKHPRRTRAEYF